MTHMARHRKAAVALGLLSLLATACASTSGSVKSLAALPASEPLSRFSKLSLVTGTRGDVPITLADRERIAQLILRRLKERAPDRYQLATSADQVGVLLTSVTFTRYDEGNAFARFMLAGLGQIHVDAEMTLEDRAKQTEIGKYEVTKTFAWGGLYGGATGIKDVEVGFADAVVDVLLAEQR